MLYTVDVNIFFPSPSHPRPLGRSSLGSTAAFYFYFFLNVTHIGQPKH